MSDTTTNESAPGSLFTWRAAIWLVVAAVCVMGMVELVRVTSAPLPSFEGKAVNLWFDESKQLGSEDYAKSQCKKAFDAMEGDAVPYLVEQLNRRPTPFDIGYVRLLRVLPTWAQTRLPRARGEEFYRDVESAALFRLRDIASAQRVQTEIGEPITKPSVALAVPALRALLRLTNSVGLGSPARLAAGVAGFMGPAAAPAVPELITLARDCNCSMAIQSFGTMGVHATSAVPTLVRIAMDDRNENQWKAIQSLGLIGAPAGAAAHPLASLLNHPKEDVRQKATVALAMVGVTPAEAVPTLKATKQSTNHNLALCATLALWNHNRQSAELQAELVAAFRTQQQRLLLRALAGLGTNAVSFIPEVKSLSDDLSPSLAWEAKRSLRLIQPRAP